MKYPLCFNKNFSSNQFIFNFSGWYITYIDRDPETIARQEALAKRDKMSKTDEERMAEFVSKQVDRVRDQLKDSQSIEDESKFTELDRKSDQKIKLESLKLERKEEVVTIVPTISSKPANKSELKRKKREIADIPRKKSAIEEIIEEEKDEQIKKEMRQRLKNDEIPWLKPNIIVKITSKTLGEKFFKQKAEVLEIIHKFKAIVKLVQDGSKVTIDQNNVETVIPAIGRQVLILQGRFRGSTAVLKNLNVEEFSAKLKVSSCDKEIHLPYEHFSKLSL